MTLYLLIGAALVFASILLTPISARTGAPLLLLFLAVGMLLGEDGPGGVHFDDFTLAYEVGSVALALILFSGGLDTPETEIRKAAAPSLILATLGVVLTAAGIGLVAARVFDLTLTQGLLLGAVVGSTDAAATFLLLQQRGIRLKGRVRTGEVEQFALEGLTGFVVDPAPFLPPLRGSSCDRPPRRPRHI